MGPWNEKELQEQFKGRSTFYAAAADATKSKARAGDDICRRSHDEAVARHLIAFMLSTDAALKDREQLQARLAREREGVREGRLDRYCPYNTKIFRKAALEYIDGIAAVLADDSRLPDIRFI